MLPLMGMSCAGMNYKVSGECKSGDGCSIHGEISGTIPSSLRSLPPQQRGALAQAWYAISGTASAGDFSLDISDSTVAIPDAGLLTVRLIDSSTGVVTASKTFPWVLSGSDIVFSDPAAVDSWAINNAGPADSVDYDLLPFAPTEAPGWNTLAAAANVDGETHAYTTVTWRRVQTCPDVPLRNGDARSGNNIIHCP